MSPDPELRCPECGNAFDLDAEAPRGCVECGENWDAESDGPNCPGCGKFGHRCQAEADL